jgi:transcriptional regulator with XRE-family HTH domain
VRAGLSQSELAARLDSSRSFVSRYERGGRLDVARVFIVCDALGISIVNVALVSRDA